MISLSEFELRYRRLFETAQDGILILDAVSGSITDVNPYMIFLLGYSRDEFMGKKLWEVGAFKDIKASQRAFEALQQNEYIRYKNLPLRAKDGELFQVEFVSNVYLEGDKEVIQCNIRNITKRKLAQDVLIRSEAYLREKSVRDHLTGLYNRRYMEATLKRELQRAGRKQQTLGIIMMDVDDFKQYNDNHGHAAGDAILQALGKLLLEHVRGEDIPSRFGGDEFIVILPDASREVTRKRAELLREGAHDLNVQYEEQMLKTITLSIGVAIFPENGTTSVSVLKAADVALYRSKQFGRDRIM